MSKTRCEICDRNFKNQEALEMHNKSKHSDSSPEKKESKPKNIKKVKNWTIGIVVIVVVVGGIFWMIASATTAGSEYEEFAQCLTDNGVKMYGAYWCPHCLDQKAIFGKSWKHINYIECSLPNSQQQNALCNAENIRGYPTWELADGTRISEVLSVERLSQASGCPLPEN